MSLIDLQMHDVSWRKSRRSIAHGACVEIAPLTGSIAVRDSVDRRGPVIKYSARSWRAFLADVKGGTFDAFC